MKRFHINYTLTAVFVLTGLFGCQTDLLDPEPLTTLSPSAAFDTPQRIEQQVNSLYRAVKSGNFLGGRYQIYNDIRAEEFINRLTNGVTGLQTWNHTLVESTNEVNNLWNAAYSAINQCNVFMKGLEDNASRFVVPTFPADFNTKVANYTAEARFLRAVSYFSLLQLYARPYVDGNGSKLGLPLRLRAELDNTNNDLKRSTVAEVYAQILADLNYAETNLPSTYSTATLRTTRAHVNTAIAFKTRVYLVMNDWDNVITEANKLVPAAAPFKAPTGVANELAASITSVFSTPYESLESIFSMPFSTLDPPGTQNQLGYYYLPTADGGNGEYFLNNSGIIADAGWTATDARRVNFIKKPTGSTGTTFYLFKFTTRSPYTDSAPVIRYAEVLLSLAEARVRSTGDVDAQAIALLNAIRGRSDASTVFTDADFADADALIAAILKERRIEFLGEGLRSIDLMRLNQPIPAKSTIAAVSPSDPNYVWPIPSGELSVNKLIERN